MKLTYSMLSTFRKCRQRMYLQYVKKVIPTEMIDNRPFIVGICVDWLFEKWIAQGYPKDWMEGKAEDIFDWWTTKRRVVYHDPTDRGKLVGKLISAVQDLQDAALIEKFPERQIVTQLTLEHPLSGNTLSGKLDLWFPEEKIIYDLKATKYQKYLDAFQLHFFGWLMESARGIRVSKLGFLSPMMRPYVKEVDWSAVELEKVEEDVVEMCTLINAGKWDKTATDCWGCPVFRFCEETAEPIKRERNDKGGFVIGF